MKIIDVKLENLTEEEIKLIKQFRKNKMELNIKHVLEETEVVYDFDNMNFKIDNDIIKVSTKTQRNLNGKHYSSSSFFHTHLIKDDARQIRDFFNIFLDEE